jgi:hypothetical protein
MLAPVVLFVYNRPFHTEQTLNALEKNEKATETVLYIFADGLKENAGNMEEENSAEVRKIIQKNWQFKEIHLIEREKNWGLAENVINGVTEIVNQYGKIIVLEDDLITSPYFLSYCNEALDLYENDKNVYAVNAFQFPLGVSEFETFLCPLGTSSWGWATWADRWNVFEKVPKYKNLIQNNEYLRNRFNFAGYDYAKMLDNPKSWAIRWYYSVFIQNGLGLFPTISLVQNIGFDGSGENCGDLLKTNPAYSTTFNNLTKQNSLAIDKVNLMLSAIQPIAKPSVMIKKTFIYRLLKLIH